MVMVIATLIVTVTTAVTFTNTVTIAVAFTIGVTFTVRFRPQQVTDSTPLAPTRLAFRLFVGACI